MNLLEFDTFELPMDFSDTSASVDAIIEGLGCFELGQECLQSDPRTLLGDFPGPLRWLAILAVRSSLDYFQLLS
jgi:hypothetical protein